MGAGSYLNRQPLPLVRQRHPLVTDEKTSRLSSHEHWGFLTFQPCRCNSLLLLSLTGYSPSGLDLQVRRWVAGHGWVYLLQLYSIDVAFLNKGWVGAQGFLVRDSSSNEQHWIKVKKIYFTLFLSAFLKTTEVVQRFYKRPLLFVLVWLCWHFCNNSLLGSQYANSFLLWDLKYNNSLCE